MRRLLFYILLCCFFSDVSYAHQSVENEVLVVIPRDAAPYRRLVASLESQFEQSQSLDNKDALSRVRLRVVALQSKGVLTPQLNTFKPNQLVVAIGAMATEYALNAKQNIRVASSFITKSAIQSILERRNKTNKLSNKLVCVLYLEQPIARVVSLLRLLRPEAKSVGSVYGPVSIQSQNAFIEQANSYQLTVNDALLSEADNPLKKLQQIFKASNAFVVLPDKSSFNRRIARWVITLSVKHKTPVIGFSQKYTQAGALVSLYSRPAQIGKQTAEMISQWLRVGGSPGIEYVYPKYFDVSVNRTVAKSLGIKAIKASVLKEQIQRMDNATTTKKTRAKRDKKLPSK